MINLFTVVACDDFLLLETCFEILLPKKDLTFSVNWQTCFFMGDLFSPVRYVCFLIDSTVLKYDIYPLFQYRILHTFKKVIYKKIVDICCVSSYFFIQLYSREENKFPKSREIDIQFPSKN